MLLPHYLILKFPEEQFSSVSVPVEHLRLSMSVFVDEANYVRNTIFDVMHDV